MNIPEIYLVEPYNAYAPKGRKKHWHEIVEEQNMLARILAEQAKQQALQEAASKTVPPQAPETSAPTVVGNTAGSGQAGGRGSGAGAGGIPAWDFWNQSSQVINFTATPSIGAAPLTVVFADTTIGGEEFDTFLWTFGDGTSSTLENPTHAYDTGSFSASFQITSSNGFTASKVTVISASIPVVTANYTFTTSSNVAPFTLSLVNTSTNTSQTPTTTYLWKITNGNITASAATQNLTAIIQSGSFTASLQATGSYNITSSTSSMFLATAPSLVAGFTYVTSSGPARTTASFTNTTVYNGVGSETFNYVFGDGTSSSLASPQHIYDSGSFTASLQVTESLYSIKSLYTQSFTVPAPTLVAGFTFTTSSNSAPSTATFLNTLNGAGGTQYNGHGSLTYLWNLGSGSITASTQIPNPQLYTTASSYTASLQVTESTYNITSRYTASWKLS